MAAAFPLGPPLPPAAWAGHPVAGWICLAPLIVAALAARKIREALALGALCGAVAFTLIFAWIPPFLVRWARLSSWEAAGVFLILLGYLALWPAAFAAFVWLVGRRRGAAASCLAAPPAWVALELLRSRLATGFPWALLGYSQERFLPAWQPADLGGVFLVAFTLVSFSGSLALVACVAPGRELRRGERAARPAIVVLAAVAAAGPIYGLVRMRTPAGPGAGLEVALVQANVSQADKWDPAETQRIETEHVAMTHSAADAGAELIIWSESSVPISTTRDRGYQRRLERLARETGAELLIGTVTYETIEEGRLEPRNSALLFSKSGEPLDRYDKRHLVPFGEYVPLKAYLGFLDRLVAEASDFGAGQGSGLMRGSRPFAVLICYEAIFPELPRQALREGAGAIINLTNDAWYGDTGMPRQHLAMSRLRAIESRRWFLRSASTGISAIVDPLGRVVASSRLDERALVTGRIEWRGGTTPYVRFGDAFAWACVMLAAFALAWRPRGSESNPLD